MRVRTRYARQRHLWFSVWNTLADKTTEAGPGPNSTNTAN